MRNRWGMLLGLLALGACSGAPPPESKPTPLEQAEVQAADEEWARILREAQKDLSVEEQQAIALSQNHYRLALAYYNKGDFERAKVEARRAVQIRHDNLPARKLLGEIHELVAGPGAMRTVADVELRQYRVGIEQAQVEIVKHLRDGERYYNARMYRQALREFQNAELKILAMPTHVTARHRLLPQAKQYGLRAKNALDNERRVIEGPR